MLIENYLLPLALLILFLLLTLLYFIGKYKKRLDKQKVIISEQKEKIKWLRQVFAENEQQFTQKEHDLEKKILHLTNSLQTLEEKAKHGTKNQVVSKLEALESKRDKLLKRANLSLE